MHSVFHPSIISQIFLLYEIRIPFPRNISQHLSLGPTLTAVQSTDNLTMQPNMDDASANSDELRGHKRRKVRKGTQSCWECKRRKAKCSLSTPGSGDVCDGCRRRGSTCISQEFPDDPASHRQQLGDRLGRVEELMVKLAGTKEHNGNTIITGYGYTDGNSTRESNDLLALSWNGQLTDVGLHSISSTSA